MRKLRVSPMRFSVGNRVMINKTIMSRHAGDSGTIVSVRSSPYSQTLDRYWIRLDSGVEILFWDIQLDPDRQASAGKTGRGLS